MKKVWTPAGIASEQIVVVSPDVCGNCGVLQRKLDTIQVELDAARADSARLNWLESKTKNEGLLGRGLVLDISKHPTIRKGIDAAMKEQAEKEKEAKEVEK